MILSPPPAMVYGDRVTTFEYSEKESEYSYVRKTWPVRSPRHVSSKLAVDTPLLAGQVPGVPVIYDLKNSLFIEELSVQQRKFAQLDEKRLHMDKSEYKNIINRSIRTSWKTSATTGSDDIYL